LLTVVCELEVECHVNDIVEVKDPSSVNYGHLVTGASDATILVIKVAIDLKTMSILKSLKAD